MSVGRFAARPSSRQRPNLRDELISRLRTLPTGPAPDPGFSADLRSQLVSITARIIAESAPEAEASAAAPAGQRAASGALRAVRRPLLAFAGASAVLVLLLAMAVWMSGGALPGESLYGVKRASENVQLSMAGNDADKGRAYLQLATNRAKEIQNLLSKPSAMPATGGVNGDGRTLSPHTASLVSDTLASADANSRSGMQLLGRAAVSQLSTEPLDRSSSWLPGQRTRLTDIRDRIPAGALHNRAQVSLNLLQRIATRTSQLTSKMGCPCLALSHADDLGPLPCDACGPVRNPQPGSSPVPGLPVPGLPSTSILPAPGTSGPLPSLSLPALGGSSTGHAAGPASSGSPTGGLPSGGQPTGLPDGLPSGLPGGLPSELPTGLPGGLPSGLPTGPPGGLPSGLPTGPPGGLPTGLPSGLPTGLPSRPISAGAGGIGATVPGGVGVGIGSGGVSVSVPAPGPSIGWP
jgi:hypothetical protein